MEGWGGVIDLPKPIIRGNTSARCISDLMRPRSAEYEHMFHPGQEQLGHYYLAPFQRPPVWTDEQSARLIESVHLGISIGSFVVSRVADEDESGLFGFTSEWLIDGQQRLRAIIRYLAGDLEVFIGTPYQHRWDDLVILQQRRFKRTTVGFIELESNDEDYLREVYDRLNFGGVTHTDDQRAVRR